MTDLHTDHLWSRNFIILKLLTAAYVVALILSHATLPSVHVWLIAAFFLVAMNFTYPWAAIRQGAHFTVEVTVSVALIGLAVLGLVWSPLFVILAIFGHGVWDLAKHNGWGTPFFRWYVTGCVVADWIYGAALLAYFVFEL